MIRFESSRLWNRPARVLPFHLALVILMLAGASHAVTLEVTPPESGGEIGKDLVLQILITPEPGQVIQVQDLSVNMTGGPGDEILGVPYPLRVVSSPASGTASFAGPVEVEWAAPVRAGISPGTHDLTLEVQVRTGPEKLEIATWTGAVAIEFGEDWSADRITDFIARRGMGLFLVVVFGFGLLMSLSPCIYPMIPITLAVIGGQSQKRGVAQGLMLSVTYVVGMALVYAVLGALSATVFSGITAFMQSPAVLVPLAVLLIVLSFAMFGAYELQAPAFLRDKLQGPGPENRGGLIGVFFMGMVAGLVASPCVGPFLAALLVWVATTGDWVLGFLSLFTFGLGMGMLLIGVGTFPALLGTMPQSGGWMETIKKGMGLLLVAMAFYFVRPGFVLPPNIFYPLLGLTSMLVAVFMGAFDSLKSDANWWSRTSKGIGLAVFVVGLYFLGGAILQYGFIMPSPITPLQDQHLQVASGPALAVRSETAVEAVQTEPLPDKVQWTKVHTGENVQAFLDQHRADAKAAGRPVMIDFWANWCVYCKKLDKMVWNVPEVVAEAQRFTTIKIDATAPDDLEMEAIKEAFQVPGLPRVIFIDSRGEVLHGRTVGFLPAAEMLEVMQGIR